MSVLCSCLELGEDSFADQQRCPVVQIKSCVGTPLAGYSTSEHMPMCVLQGKPSPLLITIFLPYFTWCQMFSYHVACPSPFLFLFSLVLFFNTLASAWMSPGVKNRSCWYSCKSLSYYFSLFWWFRRAYTLCKLNSKYEFLLTRQEKYNLRENVKQVPNNK